MQFTCRLAPARHLPGQRSGLRQLPGLPGNPDETLRPEIGTRQFRTPLQPRSVTFKWPVVGATTTNSRSKRRLDDYANLSFALSRLSTRSFPDVERATIVVGVTWRGASAQDVAGSFTAPFKHALLLTSLTTTGTSSPQRRGHAVSKLAKS